MLTPIQKGEGSTPGERELTKLADLAFFGLWSYPSVHRLMVKGGRTIKHEVIDLKRPPDGAPEGGLRTGPEAVIASG